VTSICLLLLLFFVHWARLHPAGPPEFGTFVAPERHARSSTNDFILSSIFSDCFPPPPLRDIGGLLGCCGRGRGFRGRGFRATVGAGAAGGGVGDSVALASASPPPPLPPTTLEVASASPPPPPASPSPSVAALAEMLLNLRLNVDDRGIPPAPSILRILS
jgi:hypothetical protein